MEEKDFEETLSIHDTVQYQKYNFLGEDQEEIKASKNIMELQHKNLSGATQMIKNKTINKIRRITTNANMHIFGLKVSEGSEDKLENRESPKFSTISQDSSGGSGYQSQKFTSYKKLGNLMKMTYLSKKLNIGLSRFSLRSGILNYKSRSKSCLLVNATRHIYSSFKMVCQTLNCKLDS